MQKKSLLRTKLLAAVLCAAMAAEPSVLYAEDFSDEFYSETEPEEAVPPQETIPEEEITPDEEMTSEENMTSEEPEEDTEGEQEFFSEASEETDSFTDAETELLSGTCGEGVTWKLEEGVLYIDGNGAMDDFVIMKDFWTGEIIEEETHRQPWNGHESEIREIYVGDGVSYIGKIAFSNCVNLTKVVIGNSVKKIGTDAFVNDSNLIEVSLGNSLEEIGERAFGGTGITHLVLPASIKKVDGASLRSMWNLEEIEVPDNGIYKTIDGVLYCDQGKTLLLYPPKKTGEYTVPESIEKIAAEAFSYTSLTKLVIPDSVKEIGEGAIDYSEDLKSLTFGKGIKKIPARCCFYDLVLEEVVIPEGVESVEYAAFYCCRSLKSITLPSTVKNIGTAFEKYTDVTILNPELIKAEDGSFISGIWVNVTAEEKYDYAFQVLELVNKERAAVGADPLVMDESLLETAMERGFETVLYWSHTRPSGLDCGTANNLLFGENIAVGQGSPKSVMNSWMNSSGHKSNILSKGYETIGIGCVNYNGTLYWVQCFGDEAKGSVDAASYSNRTNTRKVLVKKDAEYYSGSFDVEKTNLTVGETTTFQCLWNNRVLTGETGAVAESSDTSVCVVDGKKITAKGEGTAVITMYYPGYKEAAVTRKITVKKKSNSGSNSGNNSGSNSGNTSGNNGNTSGNNGGNSSENNTAKNYQVTFNPNSGKTATKSRTVKANSSIGTLPKATRQGYTFSGWYTAKTGGTKVSDQTTVKKNSTYYAHWTKVTVKKAVVSGLTNKNGRKMSVTLKKIKGAAGYQILYSSNKKFSGAKTKTTAKTSVTLKSLTKNKTYYVKVRAYKKDSTGKKVYGAYSSVKKIRIKK